MALNYRKYLVMFLFLIANGLIAQEDRAPISIHRLSLGLEMAFGNFELNGNDADPRIMSAERNENRTFGKSIGVGLAVNYRILKGLDIFINPHYEYINESLVGVYSLSMRDIGVRYQVVELGRFYPFVKVSHTKFVLGGLSVFDPTIGPSQTTVREYDWESTGMTIGGGIDFKVTDKLYYSIFANRLITKKKMEKVTGNVDLEKSPKYGHIGFSFWVFI